MADVWRDRYQRKWFGYWLQKLDGTWGYSVHWEQSDTDMADMNMAEFERMFGPVTEETS